MSALVRRCPNCGSTQDGAGECETCHEPEVRLFCPNHAPGRWLDAPPCDACGATLGAGPVVRTPPPPRPLPPRPTAPRPAPSAPPRVRTRRPEVPGDGRDLPVGGPARWPIDPRILRPAVRVGVPSFVGCVGRLVMTVLLLIALLAAAFAWVVWY